MRSHWHGLVPRFVSSLLLSLAAVVVQAASSPEELAERFQTHLRSGDGSAIKDLIFDERYHQILPRYFAEMLTKTGPASDIVVYVVADGDEIATERARVDCIARGQEFKPLQQRMQEEAAKAARIGVVGEYAEEPLGTLVFLGASEVLLSQYAKKDGEYGLIMWK